MPNELLKPSWPDPNADLIEQLESLSQRTTLTALDATLGIIPADGSGFAAAAAKLARLSSHVANAAQQLEPTLAIHGNVVSRVRFDAAQLA